MTRRIEASLLVVEVVSDGKCHATSIENGPGSQVAICCSTRRGSPSTTKILTPSRLRWRGALTAALLSL